MSRQYLLLLCAAVLLTLVGVSQSDNKNVQRKRVVDFQADVMRPVRIGDSSALNLLGNVVFYHNGTIITCDSAIRYNDKRMECFKNVVVNKQDTYVYGDRADYNGELNIATVYAPIIKMVDKDATLYTYKFSFNTLTNIGIFGGGATLNQKDNQLESDRGYYYADSSIVVCVKDVEMKNPDYKLISDSVSYNLNTNLAKFFTKSYIWNKKGEILSAKRGSYDQNKSQYTFTSDSYILTKAQELWCDTLDYNSEVDIALLYKDIQMIDTEHSMMAFGDFAHYWGKDGKGILTRNPSVINFSPDQPDTLYMRADSMFIYTFSRDSVLVADSASVKKIVDDEELIESEIPADSTKGLTDAVQTTTVSETIVEPTTGISVEQSLDSDGEQPLMTKAQRRKLRQERKRLDVATKQAAKGELPPQKSGVVVSDSIGNKTTDNLAIKGVMKDSLANGIVEETVVSPKVSPIDTLNLEPKAEEGQDSLQRLLLAYRNVKIYRSDFQAVCDSLVGFSIDSTAHMYIKPVLWNEANQITSTVIDIFTKNQQIQKAIFVGEPIMSSEVDTLHYNQVKGKVIETYFRNNEIYKTKVLGNGQTLYYMQDDETHEINGLFVVECADIAFDIDSNKVTKISYYSDPDYVIYPMDKIAEDQELLLPGFKWESERRPDKAAVFNRSIRESVREIYEKMSQPLFPLSKSIMDNKSRMIRDGIWVERNDKISQDTYDYIRGLGYK